MNEYQKNLSSKEFLNQVYVKINFLLDKILKGETKYISNIVAIFMELQRETNSIDLQNIYNDLSLKLLSKEEKNIKEVKEAIKKFLK